ncbi:MAG: CopG family transcriptional regulator [Deltaproteobacteria bacterium RIFCSPLOWO2_02_FULL_53_8]|nr:MAG: CopG family transcriptional regulator [Deltaproteobacteria bacterium RIFCSPLOWO2_02_FULL_53_8]
MRETITISLPSELKKKLTAVVKQEHTNRSDIVREALRQYFAREEFQRLRRRMLPQAERSGIFTDEDVFKKVS